MQAKLLGIGSVIVAITGHSPTSSASPFFFAFEGVVTTVDDPLLFGLNSLQSAAVGDGVTALFQVLGRQTSIPDFASATHVTQSLAQQYLPQFDRSVVVTNGTGLTPDRIVASLAGWDETGLGERLEFRLEVVLEDPSGVSVDASGTIRSLSLAAFTGRFTLTSSVLRFDGFGFPTAFDAGRMTGDVAFASLSDIPGTSSISLAVALVACQIGRRRRSKCASRPVPAAAATQSRRDLGGLAATVPVLMSCAAIMGNASAQTTSNSSQFRFDSFQGTTPVVGLGTATVRWGTELVVPCGQSTSTRTFELASLSGLSVPTTGTVGGPQTAAGRLQYFNGTSVAQSQRSVFNTAALTVTGRVVLQQRNYPFTIPVKITTTDTFGLVGLDDACNILQQSPPDRVTISSPGLVRIGTDTRTTPPTRYLFQVSEVAQQRFVAEGDSASAATWNIRTSLFGGSFVHLSQGGDAPWANEVIRTRCRGSGAIRCPDRPVTEGGLKDTFAADGCTITGVTMIYNYLSGAQETPPSVATLLEGVPGVFTDTYSPNVDVDSINLAFPTSSVLAGLSLSFSAPREANGVSSLGLSAIAAQAANGNPTLLQVPSISANESTVASSGGHYIVANGLTPGAPANPGPEHILISDPGFGVRIAAHVGGGKTRESITLRDYFDFLNNGKNSKGNSSAVTSSPDLWFNQGATFSSRSSGENKRSAAAGKRVRVATTGGSGSVIVGTPVSPSPAPQATAAGSDAAVSPASVTVVLTDSLSGVRWFSDESVANRWYRETAIVRAYSDPFFNPPAWATNPIDRIRLLGDPRYYNFLARRDFFDPATDRIIAPLIPEGTVPPEDDLGVAEVSTGGLTLAIPDELLNIPVTVHLIADRPTRFRVDYLTRSSLLQSSGPIEIEVPGIATHPLGILAGTFTLGSSSPSPQCTPPTPGCPADLNGDGVVDDLDFPMLAAAIDQVIASSDCAGDLNLDGFVDDLDFTIFAVSYNAVLCPNSTLTAW
jgi:hypothetical protein